MEIVILPQRAYIAESFEFRRKAEGCDIMKELHCLRRLTLLEVSALAGGPRVIIA